MYDFILRERLLIASLAVVAALVASTIAGASRLWLRGILYNMTPAMAGAFYAAAYFDDSMQDGMDLFAGLLFELTVFVVFYRYLMNVISNITPIPQKEITATLSIAMIGLIAIFLLNFSSSGFGIYSEGSRIDYLYSSRIQKYYTYMGVLLLALQATFLASLISLRGRVGALGWLVVAVNFGYSVVSGSKGAVLLWVISVLSLIDYKKANLNIGRVIISLIVLTIASVVAISITINYMQLESDDFIDLATSRFFLVNDARALALDLRSTQTAGVSFFSEAFRSLANILGEPPINDPLGVALYQLQLSSTDGTGANASFMALVTYYFPIGYALFPAVCGALGALAVMRIGEFFAASAPNRTWRMIILSTWIPCIVIYSQDFLAFQIIFPLAMLIALGMKAYQLKNAKKAPRALR